MTTTKTTFLLVLLFSISLFACSGSGNKTEEENSEAETQDVVQVTYRQFYDLMFEDYNNRLEWHEDDYNQEGKEFIAINMRDKCEKESCSEIESEKTFIKNTSTDRTIRVVMKTAYSIPNTIPYIANQFVLEPGQEVYLACTKFCFGGNTWDLDHSVVVAEYMEN